MNRRGQEGPVRVPSRPVIELVLDEQGRGTVDGRLVPIDDPDDPQASLLAEAVRQAAKLSRPVRVRALDPDGVWHLAAHPDGTVTELTDDLDSLAAPPPSDPEPEDTGLWHLRVHPDGQIISLADDDPLPPTAPHLPHPPTAPRTTSSAEDRHPAWTPPAPPPPARAPAEKEAALEPAAAQDAVADAPAHPVAPAETDAEASDDAAPTDEATVPAPPRSAPVDVEPLEIDLREPQDLSQPEDLGEPGPTVAGAPVDDPPHHEPGSTAFEESPPYGVLSFDQPGRPPVTADDAAQPTAAEAWWQAETPGDRSDPPGPAGPVDAVGPADPGGPIDPAGPQEWHPGGESAAAAEPEPPSGLLAWLNAPTRFGTRSGRSPGAGTPETDTPETDTPETDTPETGAPRAGLAQRRGDALLKDLRSGHQDPPRPGHSMPGWVQPAAIAGVGILVVTSITIAVANRAEGPSRAVSTHSSSTAARSGTNGGRAQQPAPSAVHASGRVRMPTVLAQPPATLSVAPPPGFRNTPRWALPISPAATSLVSASGRVLTLTKDNQVALVDPATGAVRWHTPVPDQATGPHLARIDGRDVAAVMTADRLVYWPLPASLPQTGDAVPEGVSVDLPAGTAVSWSGPSPLLVLGDGAAAVIRDGRIQRADLPSGMKPLAADSADVLAVSGRNWIRQGAGQGAGTPQEFKPPKDVSGTGPVRVENVGGSFLATMWDSPKGPVVAVYDAHSGALMVSTTFPKDVDFVRAPTVREAGSARTTVGSALFEPDQHNLSVMPSSLTPVSLTPGHVFANDVSGAVADLQIHGSAMKTVPFKGRSPIVPVGIVTGPTTVAVVAAPSGNGWLLFGLPAG